jgi:hypothetical protein
MSGKSVSAPFVASADDGIQSIAIKGDTAMQRIGITGFILVAAFALSAIAASSASAGDPQDIRCANVQVANTGEYNKDGCNEKGGAKLYVETEGDGIATRGIECVLVHTRGNGQFSDSTCTVPGGSKNYIEVLLSPKFTGTSGASTLETSATKAVTCESSATTGELVGGTKVGSVIISFSGCHTTEGGGCTVKGGGAGTGKIVSNTLDGELGSVKASEATSGVGLLLLPTSGTEFTKIEGSCLLLEKTPVVGTVAGEVTPINEFATESKLIFVGSKGKQGIKSIAVLGTVLKPALKALGLVEASETASGSLVFEEAVTVT